MADNNESSTSTGKTKSQVLTSHEAVIMMQALLAAEENDNEEIIQDERCDDDDDRMLDAFELEENDGDTLFCYDLWPANLLWFYDHRNLITEDIFIL